ncbi:hypothetical protein [Lysinibacillus sp. NPDC059133]
MKVRLIDGQIGPVQEIHSK